MFLFPDRPVLPSLAPQPTSAYCPTMEHRIVHVENNHFCGWPANNGLWQWDGQEILVGFIRGRYKACEEAHSIGTSYESLLARSINGGESWHVTKPMDFMHNGASTKPLPEPIDFTAPGCILRIAGCGYHGATFNHGAFYCSHDRGKTWNGPWSFGDLSEDPALLGQEMTPRTDVVVLNRHECLVFLSTRPPGTASRDKLFCARTRDGGQTWQFMAWVTPPSDPYRGVMSQTVRLTSGALVTAMRRREPGTDHCWVDAYRSLDTGGTWAFHARVGETGKTNGNPPALAVLRDGRLCCVYGNRSRKQLLARTSVDGGINWSIERVLRENYFSGLDDQDFGYPRIAQRDDGRLVVIYYWASVEHPQQHIAATIFTV